jgi:hypothetical protein
MLTRGRTLIRKTSLLRKIEPIARRSSFANKDHLQPAHLAMNERRNDLEIVKGRAIACTIQPGSISSLRCQKSRMSHPGEDGSMRSDVFADDVLDVAASIFDFIWWSQTGSNRRPHACKARALPAELWPRNQKTNAFTSVVELHLVETHSIKVVGLGRLELPTSRLSSARSNQLSYKPLTRGAHARAGMAPMHRTSASPWRVFVREERETKTAKSRLWSSTILKLLAPECF